MSTVATTRERKRTDHISERIRRQTDENIRRYADAGLEAIERRLAELDQEWTTGRVVRRNAAIVALASLALGATVNRRWLIPAAVATGFELQYALQGWCPPVAILQRLGYRSVAEVGRERDALKAARGDLVHDRLEDYVETAAGRIKKASHA